MSSSTAVFHESTEESQPEALAHRFGTPLLVYSERLIRDNVGALRSSLPRESRLVYSMKANPSPEVLRIMMTLGLMVETASGGEFRWARRAGVPGTSLMLGGPLKTADDIAWAVAEGAFAILLESLEDIRRLELAMRSAQSRPRALIRVNPHSLESHSVLRMAGTASPFGVDESDLPKAVVRCRSLGAWAGLFLYAGSQHFIAADIVSNTRSLSRIALTLAKSGVGHSSVLDFGGGFGLAESPEQVPLDLGALAAGLREVFDELYASVAPPEATLFESGRFIVGNAGTYLCRVVDVKASCGRTFAVLDGGLNILGIRQMMYRTHEPRVEVIGRRMASDSPPVSIVGPTCTPIDVVHRNCLVEDVHIGDLVAIHDCGAYTASFSPQHFCGHPWPAEVLVSLGGNARLVRRRGPMEDACGSGYFDS